MQRPVEVANFCWAIFLLLLLPTSFYRAQAFTPVYQHIIGPSKIFKAKKSTFLLSRSIPSPTRPLSNNQDSNDSNHVDDEIILDLWGDTQEWALQDNISKYTVNIPKLATSSNSITYAMWRSMTRDTIELSGYDINFIRKMHQKQLTKMNCTDSSPGVLPQLDEFEFRPNGGVSGRIQGLRGISDGTVIETSSLSQVDLTVPRGYVVTKDGSTAYELGVPLSKESQYATDVDADMVSGIANNVKNSISSVTDARDVELVANLGKTTAILLGAGVALNLLSHHLTVNVFWV